MNFYYWLGYHSSRILAKILYRFRIVHRERMIQSGPVIVAMNHQSYFDPPLAGNACDRAIYFLAKKSLMKVPLLRWLLPKLNVIPVDIEGTDRSAINSRFAGRRLGARLSRRQADPGWYLATGTAWCRSGHRQNTRAGRSDADFWRF